MDEKAIVYRSIVLAVKFDNLVVQAEPKILKWDPDDPTICDTTFTYTISSAQKKNCQVKVDIYSTEGQLVYETTLTQLCPGNYTFTWDGTNNQIAYPPNNIAPTGLYTFDIIVQGACPYDCDEMRSQIVKVQQTSLDVDSDNPDNLKFGYVIESVDSKPASEIKVAVYAPAIDSFQQKLSLIGGTKTIPVGSTPGDNDWNYVHFPWNTVDIGGQDFYVVAFGKDDSLNNKSHLRKPLTERNKRKKWAAAAIFYWDYNGWADSAKETEKQLLGGSFSQGYDRNNQPIFLAKHAKFGKNWCFGPLYIPCAMLVGEGNNEIGAAALTNVNVFVFYGHGAGDHISFGDNDRGGIAMGTPQESDKQTDTIRLDDSSIFPPGSLDKLDLIVIASCNVYASQHGFPIVAAIVAKGAKGGIGITGAKLLRGKDKNGRWWLYITWGELYGDVLYDWAKRFWCYATKGYYDQEGNIKHPTIREAALKAAKEVGDIWISKNESHRLLPPFFFSKDSYLDSYLGNLVE